MPYFAIRATDSDIDICLCQAKKIEDINTDSFLGTVKVWEVREIGVAEAEILFRKLDPDNKHAVKLINVVQRVIFP